MSIGLIALLDDIAAIAKVAAASLDDVTAQAAKAGAKAAGVVIDDAAVTPRYVTGFSAARELPIVGKIALGSLKNKLIYLLPLALLLSLFAPWAITPLLMIGGAYLCYEGSEKVFGALFSHGAHEHERATQTAGNVEDEKVSSAIKTDFILSAEIMAITLANIPAGSTWMQAVVLAIVGIGITALVYGGVALIVKADDVGVALARTATPISSLLRRSPESAPLHTDRLLAPLTRAFGRGLVKAMPGLLKTLAIVGTAAMVWVGGGIIIHGLEGYGVTGPGHVIHDIAAAAGHAVPSISGAVEWLVTAAASGLVGLLLGAILIPGIHFVAVPLLKALRGGSRRAEKPTV
ncbi:DUF808 domain-containing protein [Microvirga lotononidis]|uniref:ABC transporter n=1 Tax=Microvirga lotononidis TaxID=864069 RepID=I4YPL1_9HYPH|nr:DUF808 domain-containing protein [Microvirga lotononidis]EIM25903.1 hypothetical protein MicloDRAFT_00066320 [Microvirga lotononidis]WQO25817.1 DUF808 domain-containing protein [Microvirga lotononidis]